MSRRKGGRMRRTERLQRPSEWPLAETFLVDLPCFFSFVSTTYYLSSQGTGIACASLRWGRPCDGAERHRVQRSVANGGDTGPLDAGAALFGTFGFFFWGGARAAFSEVRFATSTDLTGGGFATQTIGEGTHFKARALCGVAGICGQAEVIVERVALAIGVVFDAIDGIAKHLAGAFGTRECGARADEFFAIFFDEAIVEAVGAGFTETFLGSFATAAWGGETSAFSACQAATAGACTLIGGWLARIAFFDAHRLCFGCARETDANESFFTAFFEVGATVFAVVEDGFTGFDANAACGPSIGVDERGARIFATAASRVIPRCAIFAHRFARIAIDKADRFGKTAQADAASAFFAIGGAQVAIGGAGIAGGELLFACRQASAVIFISVNVDGSAQLDTGAFAAVTIGIGTVFFTFVFGRIAKFKAVRFGFGEADAGAWLVTADFGVIAALVHLCQL